MTVADILALALASPLVLSVVTNLWPLYWRRGVRGPVSRLTHRALMVVQAACSVLLLMPVDARTKFGAAAALYAAMATGAAFLLRRHGAVPCGCWGDNQRQLSWGLVGADASLSLVAITQVGSRSGTVTVTGGALMVMGLAAAALVFGVALPEMRYALAGVRDRADQERRWFHRFPDLEEA